MSTKAIPGQTSPMQFKLLPLLLPLLPAYLFSANPVLSFFFAWSGSVYLLIASLSGWLSPLPADLSFAQQIMRPIIIIQLVFCGFNFITSIFYFLDALGMRDFIWTNEAIDEGKLVLLAECQRYYLLGHVFLLAGIYSRGIEVKEEFYMNIDDFPVFLLKFTGITLLLSIMASKVPGLQQFSQQFGSLNFLTCTAAFCYAIISRDKRYIIIGSLFYAFSFSQALVSGFKEPIIISLLLVGIYLYPYYKRLVMIAFLPFIYLSFVVIPAYISNFRSISPGDLGNINSETVRDMALATALSEKQSNWGFLTGRLSEISMFTRYVSNTPAITPFYQFTTLEQSVYTLIPRIFWPAKPVTEKLIMQRVYNAGVVEEASNVSAKPMYIVDGYLAYGWIGIVISLFLYGFIMQSIALKAEQWFGGYFLGTSIIFNGLFSIFWRGISFEFMFNAVFYAFLTMFILKLAMQKSGILIRYA